MARIAAKGVTEHPYVTAAGLCALENRGVQAGEVDIIPRPQPISSRITRHSFAAQPVC
jgi:hypothetical protein